MGVDPTGTLPLAVTAVRIAEIVGVVAAVLSAAFAAFVAYHLWQLARAIGGLWSLLKRLGRLLDRHFVEPGRASAAGAEEDDVTPTRDRPRDDDERHRTGRSGLNGSSTDQRRPPP